MGITDETIQEFKDKFKNKLILDAQMLDETVYQLDNQLQNTLEEVAHLIKKDQSKKETMVWQTTLWPKENTQK